MVEVLVKAGHVEVVRAARNGEVAVALKQLVN